MSEPKNKRGAHLSDLKKLEARQTATKLTKALDRFEYGGLTRLKEGAKLTRLNLAIEADVSKDTPFALYRKGHPKAGTYRFPEVVERFNRLRQKGKLVPKPEPEAAPDETEQFKETIAELQNALSASRLVANALDAQNVEYKYRVRELEELVSRVSEENDKLKSEMTKLKRQSISAV